MLIFFWQCAHQHWLSWLLKLSCHQARESQLFYWLSSTWAKLIKPTAQLDLQKSWAGSYGSAPAQTWLYKIQQHYTSLASLSPCSCNSLASCSLWAAYWHICSACCLASLACLSSSYACICSRISYEPNLPEYQYVGGKSSGNLCAMSFCSTHVQIGRSQLSINGGDL